MSRLLGFIANPRTQVRWWAFWTCAWAVLMPVTLLSFLATSIPWLQFMSLFANFASCGTALVAAWAYLRARSADEKVDEAASLAHVEAVMDRIDQMEAAHGSLLLRIAQLVEPAQAEVSDG